MTLFFQFLTWLFYGCLVYNFFNPNNIYQPYIHNFGTIMEVYFWIILLIFIVLFVAISAFFPTIFERQTKFLTDYYTHYNRWYKRLKRAVFNIVDFVIISFIGIALADWSLFFVLIMLELMSSLTSTALLDKLKEQFKEKL